jgi:hypothetical protein
MQQELQEFSLGAGATEALDNLPLSLAVIGFTRCGSVNAEEGHENTGALCSLKRF